MIVESDERGSVEQSGSGAAVWKWFDGHSNRETGVGAPPGGSVLPAPTRGTMEQLLDTLGHPERGVPVVLVAGTNGKSTTARILARLLDAAGLRVGCCASPHLHRPHERIAIGTATITDGELAAALGARLVAVTSVGVDHVEYFGPTRWDNAVAEAGAVPGGTTLVLAEPDPAMHPPFLARRPSRVLLTGRRGDDRRA